MQITKHRSPIQASQLPTPQAAPESGPVDRFEPSPPPAPLWKRSLTAGLITGAGAGVLSTFGAVLGPIQPAPPLITGLLAGGLGCAAGASQEGAFMAVAGGMIMGTVAAAATVPGMLYGYEGALMAAGGGAVFGALCHLIGDLESRF